jgi:hypothetical protein
MGSEWAWPAGPSWGGGRGKNQLKYNLKVENTKKQLTRAAF